MKGIRRAAAVCLTMTLAVSTLFGNTAWADMPQKTERKKCVHVHTEECYGEPDEEATSSQIGEEPTECTHVCTVESGCIRNTAASSGTNEDDSETGPDDEETNDQKDSADKAEDDEKPFRQYTIGYGRYDSSRRNSDTGCEVPDLLLVLV